jgi:hypothetical protein
MQPAQMVTRRRRGERYDKRFASSKYHELSYRRGLSDA